MGRLLDQEDRAPRLSGCARRRKPGDSATDHKDIDMDVEVFVGVGVPRGRGLAEPGRLPDEGLVDVLPEAPGMEEHLVVEACREEA
jgi:hypothetical protein